MSDLDLARSTNTSTTTPVKYVKVLNESLNHYGFQYKLGLNEDTIPFNPTGSCEPGGLYFTDFDSFVSFLSRGTLIADVEVPDGELIYTDPEDRDNFKAHRIIISNIRPIKDLTEWQNQEFCLKAVRNYAKSLLWVPQQTEELCLAVVEHNGGGLQYIKPENQTKNICVAAVKSRAIALLFVRPDLLTSKLLAVAVKCHNHGLSYVKPELQTEELCLVAVRSYGGAINYMKEEIKTESICLEAVKDDGLILKYIPNKYKTREVCLAAVGQNEWAIQYVPDELQTYELCKLAIKNDPDTLRFVKNQTKEICLYTLRFKPDVLDNVKPELRTPELIQAAVDKLDYIFG
jgi:hypothetical protein